MEKRHRADNRKQVENDMLERTFGIELEAISPSDVFGTRNFLRQAGFDVMDGASYSHHDSSNQWKVVTDASVHAIGRAGHGVEVVSPILRGYEGLIAIRKMCACLKAHGVKVNRTCGLHVNIDARQVSVEAIKACMVRYAQFERTIDAFQQNDRRGNSNQYCRSVSGVLPYLNSINSKDDFSSQGISRYHKVQCSSSWRSHGTIEFRHHGGTIDAEKISQWIVFCDAFLSESERLANNNNQTPPPAQTMTARRVRRTHSDGHIPHQWFRLLDFINNNWISITALQRLMITDGNQGELDRGGIATIVCHLRQRGYAITTSRRNGEAGYRWDGITPDAETVIATTQTTNFENDSLWNGIPLDCRAFYEFRAEQFRNRENAA